MPCSGFSAPERLGATCPPDYGDGGATYRHFSRWRQDGTWGKLLDAVSGDPNLEWLMINGRLWHSPLARARGMAAVMPPRRNWKAAWEFDAALCQARHPVENGFSKLQE